MGFAGGRRLMERHEDIELEYQHQYLIATEIASGKIILDIASGDGHGSSMLAKVADKVFGVDVSVEAVSCAREQHKEDNLEFIVGSCENIPLPNASVDIVVSFKTIEYHDKHEKMIREIKRVLRPKGALIISSTDKYNNSIYPNHTNPHYVKELFEQEFKNLLGDNFKNCKYFRQRVTFGSIVYAEDACSNFNDYTCEGSIIKKHSGLSRPIYWVAYVSDGDLQDLSSSLYELPEKLNDHDMQSADMHLKFRKKEIEGYKAQFQLSCKLLHKDRVIEEKDRMIEDKNRLIEEKNQVIEDMLFKDLEIWKIFESRSMRLTKPLRDIACQYRRVRSTACLIVPAIRHGGGVLSTIQKAVRLYRIYGVEGIKRGFRVAATSKHNIG